MGTRVKIVDVIPQVPKSSHWPPPPTSLIRDEIKSFFMVHGIATSHCAVYNPRGNGQCERYNGVIWKTIELALHSKQQETVHWDVVLQESLHCIRTLL